MDHRSATPGPLPTGSLGLRGQTVLLTGGAGGIGSATAGYLVTLGARIVLTGIDHAALGRARDTLSPRERVLTLHADNTDEGQMTRAVATAVEHFGRLDGLVAAAGIRQKSAPALESPRGFGRPRWQ